MSESIGNLVGEWLERLRPRMVNEAEAARWEAEQARLAVERIGLPEDIRAAVASGLNSYGKPLRESEGDRWLADADAKRKRLVVLAGQPGTGKTLAASRWLVRHPGGRYVAAAKFAAGMVAAKWSKRQDALYDASERYRVAMALVLDDAGENETVEESAHIAELLRHRYDERLPTVVTTNLSSGAFVERYGDRIASRIAEHGGSVTLKTVLRPGAAKLKAVKP